MVEVTGKIGAMKGTDLVFVDIETTGLDPRIQEIIEISVIRVKQLWQSGEKPQFQEVAEWSAKIRPQNMAVADPAALKVNGYIPSDWKHAIPLKDALEQFVEKTEGAIMVSHNVAFDAGFLDENLARLGLPNKMHYHRLDTVSMAFAVLHSTPDVSRYSLVELCKYFNIPIEHAHSALPDARADFELFKKLILP